MIEVSRLKDLNTAKLFLGFRVGAVGRRNFAVFPLQRQRGLRRLKRYLGDKVSVGAQMVVVLKAFVERCISLVLGHPFKFSWLEVSQTDVFHRFLCSFFYSGWEPAAQPCGLDRSSHGQGGAYSEVAAGETIPLLPSGPGRKEARAHSDGASRLPLSYYEFIKCFAGFKAWI
jgi:hypothetical protein